MKEIFIATKNRGKVKEFESLFEKLGMTVQSLLDIPEIKEGKETGTTFAENAIIKAEAVLKQLGKMAIADDSGLCIDALRGRPGVFSARYAGEQKDDRANIEKVLTELEGVPFEQRTARFHCAIAVAIPGKKTKVVEEICEGYITEKMIGENGFGYDPIFYVPEKKKTMAQLESDEKNQISHRAKALRKLVENWEYIIK